MNKVTFFCVTLLVSFPTSADGQDKEKPVVSPAGNVKNASPFSLPFEGAGNLFQSAADLRAASESMERFGESLERTTNDIGGTADSVAEHLAQMSSGFDPLGLQNAFKTIQQQAEVIRQQQGIIYRLQQNEIQRLKRLNKQLTVANNAAKSPTGKGKKKPNRPEGK